MKAPPGSTHKARIRECWERGYLRYKLHDGQKIIAAKIDTMMNQLFVGECSRQFGKTFIEVVLSMEPAIQKPLGKIKIGTAFHTDLVEFVLPAFEAVLKDCPLSLLPKYLSHKSKWIFKNGSEIKLIGLDRKPNGLRGTIPDRMLLDEAAFMSNLNYLYKSVIIPATTHRPDCKILVFSTPPSTPAHEFIDYVAKAKMEGGHCMLTIFDNPMVNASTIVRLMKETGCTVPEFDAEAIVEEMRLSKSAVFPNDGRWSISTTFRREYLCEHITDENLTIIPEWKSSYVQNIERNQYYGFYHKYVSMDLGIRDHTACIFGYYDFLSARLIIEDEFFVNGPEVTTLLILNKIKEKEASLWGEGIVYRRISDNNNPLLLNDLANLHGLHFSATDKGSLEEMVNKVRLMVLEGSVIIHPRCKQLIGCLEFGVWDKRREKFARTELFGHFDALAALVYLIRNVNRVSNPIPADFNLDISNQILFSNRDSPTIHTLRKAFNIR